MPPMVARLAVDKSTGNHRPIAAAGGSARRSTMPARTMQVLLVSLISTSRFRCLEQS